jgi:hypothetical protein
MRNYGEFTAAGNLEDTVEALNWAAPVIAENVKDYTWLGVLDIALSEGSHPVLLIAGDVTKRDGGGSRRFLFTVNPIDRCAEKPGDFDWVD